MSVPDADMLISISEVLETPVSTLLGENIKKSNIDDLKAISEKLEVINLQLARRKITTRKIAYGLLISLCVILLFIFIGLLAINGSYLSWSSSDPETVVFKAAFHVFEWLFVRVAPIVFVGAILVMLFIRKRV